MLLRHAYHTAKFRLVQVCFIELLLNGLTYVNLFQSYLHMVGQSLIIKQILWPKTTKKNRPSLTGMQVDEFHEFTIERLKSVRNQASELGAILDQKFVTFTDRIKRIINIKRIR